MNFDKEFESKEKDIFLEVTKIGEKHLGYVVEGFIYVVFTRFYDCGGIKRRYRLRYELRHGLCEEFHENGVMKERMMYVDGWPQLRGSCQWHANGNIGRQFDENGKRVI